MSEWKQETLKDLVDVDPDQLPSTTDPDYSFFYIDISSVSFGNVSLPNLSIKYKDAPSRARKILKDNDILMSTVRPNLKAFAQFRKRSKSNFIASTGFAVLRSKPNVEVGFIYHSLFSNEVEKQIEALVVGSNYPAINSGDVRNLKIIIPSFPIQQKIAKILSTCDSVIEQTQSAISKYKAIKQGLLHDLFTRGLDANGKLRLLYEEAPELYKESELGMIPKDWEVKRLEEFYIEILDGDRGVNYPKSTDFFSDEFCLFLSATNVTKNGFVFQNMQFITKEKDLILGTGKLQRNDFVLTTRGTVGNMAFYSDDIQFENLRINSGMLILRNNQNDINSTFLYLSIKEYIFGIEYGRVISGSAQPQLPIKDFRKFNLLRPEIEEQIEITKRLTSIDKKLQSEETLLQKYKSIKRGLMGDLLDGKKEL